MGMTKETVLQKIELQLIVAQQKGEHHNVAKLKNIIYELEKTCNGEGNENIITFTQQYLNFHSDLENKNKQKIINKEVNKGLNILCRINNSVSITTQKGMYILWFINTLFGIGCIATYNSIEDDGFLVWGFKFDRDNLWSFVGYDKHIINEDPVVGFCDLLKLITV